MYLNINQLKYLDNLIKNGDGVLHTAALKALTVDSISIYDSIKKYTDKLEKSTVESIIKAGINNRVVN